MDCNFRKKETHSIVVRANAPGEHWGMYRNFVLSAIANILDIYEFTEITGKVEESILKSVLLKSDVGNVNLQQRDAEHKWRISGNLRYNSDLSIRNYGKL